MGSDSRGAHQHLLDEFATYDEHVDVVSAFEWLFTDPGVADLPATVHHFERFPKIGRPDGSKLTPDFTVLFVDDTAIVGEVAKIAQPEESVDKLCRQLANYDTLDHVPGPIGLVQVKHVDVVQFVQHRVGLRAVRRIIRERMENATHEYKPGRPPCIVQYSRTSDVYVFQRIPDAVNGKLLEPEGRTPNIARYLDNDLSPRVDRFIAIKTRRAFINDQVPPLYLATHLWTKTWPTTAGRTNSDYSIDVHQTAQTLRDQYGVGSVTDVKRALQLLKSAGLVAPETDGSWTVSRRQLGRVGARDVHKIIAERSVSRPKPLVTARRAPAGSGDEQHGLW